MPEHHRLSDGHPDPRPDSRPPVLNFARDDLRTVRHDVTRFAQDHGLTDPALYRFVLAVHEIATNAVRHGGGHGRLELQRTRDQLRCRISDRGPGMPPTRRHTRPALDAPSGRGLWLAQHAGELTWTSDDHGTTVTLICPVAPPAAVDDVRAEPQVS